MVALRADDDVDRRLAAQDFGALGLGDAARHDQGRPPAGLPPLLFQFAQLAELGVDFLGRLFADVAGVENDEVGVLDPARLSIAVERRQIGHALRIVDVHLAAEGLDERPPGSALRASTRLGERLQAWSIRTITVSRGQTLFRRFPAPGKIAALSRARLGGEFAHRRLGQPRAAVLRSMSGRTRIGGPQ